MTDEKLTRSLTKVSRMLALFLLLFAIEDAFVLKYGLVRYGGPCSAVYLGLFALSGFLGKTDWWQKVLSAVLLVFLCLELAGFRF